MRHAVVFLLMLLTLSSFAQEDGNVEFVVRKQMDTTIYLSGVYACTIIKKSKFYIPIKIKAKKFSIGKSREIAKAVIQFFDGGVCKIYCINFNRKGEITTQSEVKDFVYNVEDSSITISYKPTGKGSATATTLFYGIRTKDKYINFVNDRQLVSIFNNKDYAVERRSLLFTQYKLNQQ